MEAQAFALLLVRAYRVVEHPLLYAPELLLVGHEFDARLTWLDAHLVHLEYLLRAHMLEDVERGDQVENSYEVRCPVIRCARKQLHFFGGLVGELNVVLEAA